jgi:hypothetical protein
MVVRVAKIDCRGGHPRENHRQIRRSAAEVERGDAGVLQPARRRQDICRAHAKGGVQPDGLRCGSGRPESKHRLSGRANPKKRSLTSLGDMRHSEANDVAIEAYGLVQVADREVHFEQIPRFNHQTACASLHKTSRTRETFHWWVPTSE